MKPERMQTVQYKGVKIDNVNFRDVRKIVHETITNGEKGYICVNDVGNVIMASRDTALLHAVNSSLISVADGMPLAWFARLAGARETERIPGMDLMIKFFSENNGYRHFLLGDTEERIGRVMKKAAELNDGIQIRGYSPPFKSFDGADNKLMTDRLNRENPDIIWVSFGGGKQEKWMHDTIGNLNRGVMVGIGAGFKWFLGDLRNPPGIIQKMGLQWTYRQGQALIENPRNAKRVARILMQKVHFCIHFLPELVRARKKL
jgi:N-acetylglucosaminyldiphosphoundecaprenol N-acetyl-beta-D-mannosaminyltransferase